MSVKTETKQIGEHAYTVKQWDATKAMIMKIKIGKYFGNILASIAGSKEPMEVVLMKNLGKMLEGVDEDAFVDLIKDIACSATRDGAKMNKALFDSYFTDNLVEPYELAFFVVKVNYEDFLASILSFSKGK